MTDEEIFNLMYEYADAFSSCAQFSKERLLEFARAIREFVPTCTPVKVKDYTDELWKFAESADKYLGRHL